MGVSNPSTRYVDLTTVARVRRLIGIQTAAVAEEDDAHIALLITEVSRELADQMGIHTLLARRTDYYKLQPNRRELPLDAFPVTTLHQLRVAPIRDFSSAVPLITPDDYWVDPESAVVHFSRPPEPRREGLIGQPKGVIWVEVDATAGLGTTAAEVATSYPDIANACAAQVADLYDRAKNAAFSSTKTTGGDGGTFYAGAYDLLPHVKRVVHRYRRVRF